LSDTLLRVLFLAVVLGLVTIVIGWPLIDFVLYLIDSSAEVEGLAADYANIRIWSAPAVLCVYAFTGIFIGMHNTRAAFVLQLVLNIINVLLDLLFVLGFDWGVEGVALASVIAEYLAMFCGFYLLRVQIGKAIEGYDRARLLERVALMKLFTANSNIFVRTLCLLFAFSYFTAKSASQGEVILAANAILLHLQSIMAYGLDGFAHAVEGFRDFGQTLVGDRSFAKLRKVDLRIDERDARLSHPRERRASHERCVAVQAALGIKKGLVRRLKLVLAGFRTRAETEQQRDDSTDARAAGDAKHVGVGQREIGRAHV
jgi:putative MATE family efflux protein